ncbi:MAG: hypothetical protein AB2L09_10490 [Coriobacteriia bacterium]
MKKKTARIVAGTTGALTLIGGCGLAIAGDAVLPSALVSPGAEVQPADANVLVGSSVNQTIKVPNVQGKFAYNQDVITANDKIKNVFGIAAAALCSTPGSATSSDPDEWTLTVSKDGSSQSASLGDYAKGKSQTKVVGCACSGNLPGGGAIANAQVTGVPVADIVTTTE